MDCLENNLKACVKDLLVGEKNMKLNNKRSARETNEAITEKRDLFVVLVHRLVGTNDRRLLSKIKQILAKANTQWKAQNENVNHTTLKNLLNELGVVESKALDNAQGDKDRSNMSSRHQTPLKDHSQSGQSDEHSDR